MTALSLLLKENFSSNDSINTVINGVLIRLKVHPDVRLINTIITIVAGSYDTYRL